MALGVGASGVWVRGPGVGCGARRAARVGRDTRRRRSSASSSSVAFGIVPSRPPARLRWSRRPARDRAWKSASSASCPQAYSTSQAPTPSRACARPRIGTPPSGTRSTLIGANQSGASICACGGTQLSSASSQGQANGSGAPLAGAGPLVGDARHRDREVDPAVAEVRVPAGVGLVGAADRARVERQHVLGGHRQQLADLVAGQRRRRAPRAPKDISRPAAPEAWPVFSEPVEPISTMSALPPYWVRFELRKKLVVGG